MPATSRGLADVVAASTALSDIDGRAGRLFYRGYDVDDLVGKISFEECVYLLHRGALPTAAQLDRLGADVAQAREIPPIADRLLPELAATAQPMEALRTVVSALGHEDPDKDSNAPDADLRKALRLVAAVPVVVARYAGARRGRDEAPPEPDPTLGIAGNFLLQITGQSPSPETAAAFDECLVLNADHTINASSFAARVCAATLSDMHSAVVAAIGTLKGPLHGGANEQVMRLLESVDKPEDADAAIRGRLSNGERIAGFGHRIYRGVDPRATHLRRLSERLSDGTGDRSLFERSKAVESTVLEAEGLYPNVDFFAVTAYAALGIPTDLFTTVLAVSRMAGWTAHIMEQHADNRLIRPDSEYVGEHNRTWVPLAER